MANNNRDQNRGHTNGDNKNKQPWTTLAGTLGRDAEMRYTATGTGYVQFSLAENLYNDDGEQILTQWYKVTIWDSKDIARADIVNSHDLRKGTFVKVGGFKGAEKWTDKDNQEHTNVTLRVFHLSYFDKSSRKFVDVLVKKEDQQLVDATGSAEIPF